MNRDRWLGIQDELKEFDWYGACMFLCLLSIMDDAGYTVNFFDLFRAARRNNWLGKDGTVFNALAILEEGTGRKWSRYTTSVLGGVGENEYTVEQWKNDDTGFTHYRRRYVDTLYHSITVAMGELVQYHVFVEER